MLADGFRQYASAPPFANTTHQRRSGGGSPTTTPTSSLLLQPPDHIHINDQAQVFCTNFTLATVSTGWKIRSSDTPATAAPIIRAGPLPPPPLGALVATTAGWWFIDVRMLMVFATEVIGAALRRGWIAVVSGDGLRRRKGRAQVKLLSSGSSAAVLAGVKLTLHCEDDAQVRRRNAHRRQEVTPK